MLLQSWATAADQDRVDDLVRKNQQLEERVRHLEQTALAEDIENYLEQRTGVEGGTSIVPGGLAIRFSGHVRIREDIAHHQYSPANRSGNNSFEFTHMRTRFRADVDVYEDIALIIEFQDIRKWGAEGSTTGLLNAVDLKRGIMLFKNIGGSNVTVEAGRMFMFYGDQRIIGHLDWLDFGHSYNGIRVKVRPENWWVDLMVVRVNDTSPVNDDDRVFYAAYGGYKWLEFYALFQSNHTATAGEVGTDVSEFLTIGFRIHRKTNDEAWDYTAEVVFQTGDVSGDDLSAFGAVFNGGYTFRDAAWKPRLGIEVAFATGDDDPTDGDQKGLQTLFPTNHLHYGHADVVGWNNLLNLHVRLTTHPIKNVILTIGYHHFRRIEEQGQWVNVGGGLIRSGFDGSDKHLGDEVDLTVVWKARKGVVFLVKYAVFLPGGFVEDTGDDPVAHVAYIQTLVKF